MWHSHSSVWGCCLGAVAPRFLATFHRSCVVAVQALILPRPARLDISLLPTWRLALGPCFLVGSPTIRRHPWGVTVGGSCMSPQFEMLSTVYTRVSCDFLRPNFYPKF